MSLSVAEKSRHKIVELLYRQTTRVAISHALAVLLIGLWYVKVQPSQPVMLWIAGISVILGARLLLNYLYKKYYSYQANSLWMHAWSGLTAITGLTYSLAFIAFTPVESSEHIFAVLSAIIALSAAACVSYSASQYAVLSFFLPVTIPAAAYFGIYGGQTGLIFLFVLCFYSTVMLTLIRRVNQTFKRSISLNYQHQQEIEKRKLAEKQLQDISRRDGLTGLFNRRYFDEMLEVEIGRAHRNHQSLCLVMFDVDYFKEYNDYYGHIAGDNCLIAVADLVSKLANRKGDLLARYGGEEFAIILPNIDMKGAIAFGNKVQQTVQKHRIPHESSKLTTLKTVTVSVGVTNLMPFKKVSAKDLISDADAALYKAKRQGRNRVHYKENNGLGEDLT